MRDNFIAHQNEDLEPDRSQVADRATLFTLTYVHSVYECGPWCGCDRARCQNRLVQRGIRVRLQVFQTDNCGWGVRCRDDLDRGTFVCTYAGELVSAFCEEVTAGNILSSVVKCFQV